MKRVIDCSVAFRWIVAESDTAKAVQLRDDYRTGVIELVAPDFLPVEIGNAILMAERAGRIVTAQGPLLLADVLNLLPVLHPTTPDLLPRAYEIASSLLGTACTSHSLSSKPVIW